MSLVRQQQTEEVEPWTTVRRPEQFQALIPVSPNDGSVEVPLRTTSSGFLSGEVGLDGFNKNVNFIIDTAASITVISEKLSQEEQLLDLLQSSKMRVFGAAGVTEDVKLLQLPRLSLGLSSLDKINAAVLDLEPVNETAGFTQAGILGGNFLRHFRIYFDFARGAMRLEPLNQKSKNGENVQPEAVVTP
jgi:predicted aspartyl protease